jgi:hypothetical protein
MAAQLDIRAVSLETGALRNVFPAVMRVSTRLFRRADRLGTLRGRGPGQQHVSGLLLVLSNVLARDARAHITRHG